MTMKWGFLAVLIALVIWQISAKKFHPCLYWVTIVASTTFGTTMADFSDGSLGFGYAGGSSLLLALLLLTLGLWYFGTGIDLGRYRQHTEGRGILLGCDQVLADAWHGAWRLDG